MATAPTRPGPVPEYSGTLLQFRECVRAGNVDELGNWLSVLAGDARFRPELRIMADRDPHSTVRAMAFRVLGECGDEESRSLFESHLQRDEAWNVRSNCAWALGKTGDPSALSLLRKAAADDPSEAVRAHSQAAVRRLESPPPR
ncbi:MAG: HEAT repeat domain-containing protein [Planctomycetes bacterium]|nr:HEAT repeat domain-containing protein [Planctomycetota bacterium]